MDFNTSVLFPPTARSHPTEIWLRQSWVGPSSSLDCSSAITFLRHAHKVLVELLVHVFVMKDRHRIDAAAEVGEHNSRTQRLRVNVGGLRMECLRGVVREAFAV